MMQKNPVTTPPMKRSVRGYPTRIPSDEDVMLFGPGVKMETSA